MDTTRVKLEMGFTEQPDPAEVRRALAAVLESSSFRASKRCHDFLGYVVTKVLDGSGESLKERTLAVDVFGRKANADLSDDSIVRVGAREVRKRLAQYYVLDGARDPVRIDLPAGSYVPTFHCQHTPPREHAGSLVLPVPEAAPLHQSTSGASRVSRRFWLLAVLAVAVVTAPAIGWEFWPGPAREFEAFWRPAFARSSPVLLGMAHPLVYFPTARVWRLDEATNGSPPSSLQRPIQLPPSATSGSDYVPVTDQFVGFGDTVAASRLAFLFAQHSQEMRLRLASQLAFADMRDSSTVLIGAFTNRWTIEVTQGVRYHFSNSPNLPGIVDAQTGRRWMLTGKTDNGRSTEDYILICRMPHAPTGGFLVIGAGLTQYGTGEAGRILADPESLEPVLRKAGPGWRTRNLELVLHSRIVGESPTPPELIASHIW